MCLNVILPLLFLSGIGHFTILDAEKVTPQDAGNNFFLHHTSIGKSRAEEAVRFLSELNDSVEGVANTSVSKHTISSFLFSPIERCVHGHCRAWWRCL